MPDGLSRLAFPQVPEEVLFPQIELGEVEQELTLDAWADRHEHATVPITMMIGEGQSVPGRYCEPCGVLRTARYATPFYEVPKRLAETWYVWVDLATLILAAFAVALLIR